MWNLFRSAGVAFLFLLFLGVVRFAVLAQQPIVTYPTHTPREAEFHKRRIEVHREVSKAFHLEFASRRIEDYAIAYVAPAVTTFAADSLASPDNLARLVPTIQIISTETQVLAQNDLAVRQFDLIIVHVSALAEFDLSWVRKEYRLGVSVTTIGMRFEDHQHVTGDFCTTPGQVIR